MRQARVQADLVHAAVPDVLLVGVPDGDTLVHSYVIDALVGDDEVTAGPQILDGDRYFATSPFRYLDTDEADLPRRIDLGVERRVILNPLMMENDPIAGEQLPLWPA